MNVRGKFVKAMRREIDSYVPKNIGLCKAHMQRFEKEYGHTDIAKEWNLPIREIHLPFQCTETDFSKWLGSVDSAIKVNEWGIGFKEYDSEANLSEIFHPLARAVCVEEVLEYPFPVLPEKDIVKLAGVQCRTYQQQGWPVMTSTVPVGGTIFWPAYKLRGMVNFLCDMYCNPEIARALLDRICELCTGHAAMAASVGADIIHLADDLGTQTSTYMSPDDFRYWIKPRLREVIVAAKKVNPEILVHFHSDGMIATFIPDLIEIGVDILNPIQPECMDPLEIKKLYGDKLSFSGCIGTQTTMPYGTPDQVSEKVRICCENVGKDGGLWIAPTHLVEPEVPWENILAFINTADEYCG